METIITILEDSEPNTSINQPPISQGMHLQAQLHVFIEKSLAPFVYVLSCRYLHIDVFCSWSYQEAVFETWKAREMAMPTSWSAQ